MNTSTIARRTGTIASGIIGITLVVFLALAGICVIAGMVGGMVDIATGHNQPTATTPAAPVDAPAGDGPIGCWNEPNSAMPGGVELIQGPVSAAPVGSVIADCPTN